VFPVRFRGSDCVDPSDLDDVPRQVVEAPPTTAPEAPSEQAVPDTRIFHYLARGVHKYDPAANRCFARPS
jgi:hypothetical protein